MRNQLLLANNQQKELAELLEIYSKNWLAMDGLWFQAVEKKYGMDEAMQMDVDVWKSFTIIEAKKIKKFLNLPENSGLDGLEKALQYRLYANINEYEIQRKDNELIYRTLQCRVQTARERKKMPYHPCKSVGIVEYDLFAKEIDNRIDTTCLSCYPDIEDETCNCSWKFTLNL